MGQLRQDPSADSPHRGWIRCIVQRLNAKYDWKLCFVGTILPLVLFLPFNSKLKILSNPWFRYRNMKDVIQAYRGSGSRLTSADYFAASGVSGTSFPQFNIAVD